MFSPAISQLNQTLVVMVCEVVSSQKARFVVAGTDCAEHQTTLKCVKSSAKFTGYHHIHLIVRWNRDTTTDSKAFLQISEVTNPRQTTTDANCYREILLTYTIGIFHDLSTCDTGAFTMQCKDLHNSRSHVKSEDTHKRCYTIISSLVPCNCQHEILQAHTGEFCVLWARISETDYKFGTDSRIQFDTRETRDPLP